MSFPALGELNPIVLKIKESQTLSHRKFTTVSRNYNLKHLSLRLVQLPIPPGKKTIQTSSPRCHILLELPGQTLGRHLKFFVLRPFDIDDHPTREANDSEAPLRKRDAAMRRGWRRESPRDARVAA